MTDHPHPQRLAPPAPIGTLLKRAAGLASSTSRRRAEPAYLDQVRQCPCLSCGLDPCGEAAHVRLQSAAFGKHGGLGRKPADRWSVPLCGSCHRVDGNALHRIGEAIFWDDLGINPLLICARLYAGKGDLPRMQAIVLLAIAERNKTHG